jgi:hypothetical protein
MSTVFCRYISVFGGVRFAIIVSRIVVSVKLVTFLINISGKNKYFTIFTRNHFWGILLFFLA